MTAHLHWTQTPRRELSQRDEWALALCKNTVRLNDIVNDWGECRCEECLRLWRWSRMRMLAAGER